MFTISKKEPAVSPVIGTILLVAITVVLVAIIAAVVMGLADSEDGKKVGMNAQADNVNTARAKLILYGGESLSELVKLEMIDQDSPYGEYVEVWNIITDEPLTIGFPYQTKKDVAKPPEDLDVYDTKINVKGTFSDGREVVLLVQPMTFGNVFGSTKTTEYIAGIKYEDRDDIYPNYRRLTDVKEGDRGDLGKSLTSAIEIKFVDPLPDKFFDVLVKIESITPGKENAKSIAKLSGSGSFTSTSITPGQWLKDVQLVDSGVPGEGVWRLTLTIRPIDEPHITEYWDLY